jgi:hypothetical protein
MGRSELDFEVIVRATGNQQRNLRLRAKSRIELKLWVTGLQNLVFSRNEDGRLLNVEAMSRVFFKRLEGMSKEGPGAVSWEDVRKLFVSLGVRDKTASLWYCEKAFRQYDKLGSGVINESQFRSLFKDMMTKKVLRAYFDIFTCAFASCETDKSVISGRQGADLSGIMSRVATRLSEGTEDFMGLHQICLFLREVQSEKDVDLSLVENMLKSLAAMPNAGRHSVNPRHFALTKSGFSILMCSDLNLLLDPTKAVLHQDLTLPLSRYWINCSHNTYLKVVRSAGRLRFPDTSTSCTVDVVASRSIVGMAATAILLLPTPMRRRHGSSSVMWHARAETTPSSIRIYRSLSP